MPFKKIKQLLQDNIGLHSETIGDSSIERAIFHRMEAVNVSHANAYLSKLMKELVFCESCARILYIEE